MDNKKGSLVIAIGKMKPKSMMGHDREDHDDEDDSGIDPGLESASEDLINAVHKNDAEAVAEALKYAFECLSGHHESDDEEEDHKASGY